MKRSVALIIAAGLLAAGCGSSNPHPTSLVTSTLAAPPTTTTTAVGAPTTTTIPTITAVAEVNTAYNSFLADVTGLDDQLQASWIDKMEQVSAPSLVRRLVKAAQVAKGAKDHFTGTLADAHRLVIEQNPEEYSITGCLDENNFYLVRDSNNRAVDPASRGYYNVSALAVLYKNLWLISVWRLSTTPCSF